MKDPCTGDDRDAAGRTKPDTRDTVTVAAAIRAHPKQRVLITGDMVLPHERVGYDK